MNHSYHHRLFVVLVATALLLTLMLGCSTTGYKPAVNLPPLRDLPPPELEAPDILALSDEMRAFLERHVLIYDNKLSRLRNLVYAVNHPGLLGYDYSAMETYTAEESFDQRSGNCVAFSNMFVALARGAGFNASYQEVAVPPSWSERRDIWLLNLHLNVRVRIGTKDYTIDVSDQRISESIERKKLPDASGFAHYYNNLGVEALFNEELAKAYWYFRTGLEGGSGLSFLWTNLGVVYRRAGQDEDAEWANKRALEINGGDYTAMNNLAQIYEEQSRLPEAKALRVRAEDNRLKNPYYLLLKSEDALSEGRYRDAEKLQRRALKRKPEEYRLHFALAKTQYLLKKYADAEQSFVRARELAPPKIVKSDLSQPLAVIMQSLQEQKN